MLNIFCINCQQPLEPGYEVCGQCDYKLNKYKGPWENVQWFDKEPYKNFLEMADNFRTFNK